MILNSNVKNIFLTIIIVFSVIAVTLESMYLMNHSTNKKIVQDVEQYLKNDSNRIKMLYDSMYLLSTDSFPEVHFLYRSRQDSIRVNNVGNFSKGDDGFFNVSPGKYDFAFSKSSFSFYTCYIFRKKYLGITLQLINYSYLNSYLIYAKDSDFVVNKYHSLPLIKPGDVLPEKPCLYMYNENWFLAIK